MWQDGVIATDYIHACHGELAPAHLALALLARGVAPPAVAGQPFRYAELGCGQGLTTNMLAALHPAGRFEAIDLLASHMDGAAALAQAAGHDNVAFRCESFAEFAERDGAEFDIIALHGIWTWVDADNRRILKTIIDRRLKPGGALFVSYNCLPGWAPDMPVRALLLQAVERAEGTLSERIDAGLAELRRMAAMDGYFQQTPSAAELVEKLQAKSDAYIAHEYLNQHWTPFYSAEVARDLGEIGLSYAASATITADVAVVDSETLADIRTNRRFRRDIFVRQPRHMDASERAAALSALRVALTVPLAEVSRDLRDPVAVALAAGPCRLDTLPGDGEAVLRSVLALVGAGMAAPSLEPGDAARCQRLNAAILAANRTSPAIRQLAAPAFGAALVVDILDRLFLLAEAEGADAPALAWSVLSARGKRLRRGGQWLDGDDNLVELRRLHAEFDRERRPFLAAAGIA
ncbi:MAG: class I SAM-dependent methyltransferase [Bacteroidota bacterium]